MLKNSPKNFIAFSSYYSDTSLIDLLAIESDGLDSGKRYYLLGDEGGMVLLQCIPFRGWRR